MRMEGGPPLPHSLRPRGRPSDHSTDTPHFHLFSDKSSLTPHLSRGRLVAPRMISKTNTHNHFPPLYLPLQFPAPLTGGVQPGCREHSSVLCGSRRNSQTCARFVEQTVAHPSVALLNAEHIPLGVTPHRVGSIFTFSLLLRSWTCA